MKRSFFNIFKGKSEDTEGEEPTSSVVTQTVGKQTEKPEREASEESKDKAALAKDRLEQILELSGLGGNVEIGWRQ